jgi:uncharacterized membrane protein YhaH (DUF805 family)
MDFIEAIKSGHSKTFHYSGRSSRSEFWWFLLYSSLFSIGGIFFLIPLIETALGPFMAVAYGCYVLWLALINLALITRRFHDIGYSGVWTFLFFLTSGISPQIALLATDLSLVFIIASLPLLFWIPWCKAGQSGSNRYGSNPLSSDAGSSLDTESKNTEGIKSHSQPIISENLNLKQYSVAQAEDRPREKVGITKTVSELSIDQEHFAQAYKEIETGKRKDGLWAMAYAATESEEAAKKKYINLRAEELNQETLARVEQEAKEKKLLREKQTKEDKLLKEIKAEEERKIIDKLPDLTSWAYQNNFVIQGGSFEEGFSPWKIRKLPFGDFEEFEDDLSFAQHLTLLRQLDLNPEEAGYILAGDYAEKVNMRVEDVTQQLRDETLKGQLIKNRWFVKVSD